MPGSWRIVTLLAATLAGPALAGGPGPAERLFVLGHCGASGCTWTCDAIDDPECAAAGESCSLPAPRFAARLRVAIDDQVCSGAAGGMMTIALVGRRDDGSDFSIPDTTFDFCGVQDTDLACGGSRGLCPDGFPRAVVFLCTTVLPNGVLDETSVPDADWLTYSDFPPPVAQALKDAFPGVAGEPIIETAIEESFDDEVGSVPLPTSRELCITGAFAEPTAPLTAPAALAGLSFTTSPASLAFGDCPTLPPPSTTSTTSSTTTTTTPSGPCDGRAPDATVGCLLDAGATGCAKVPGGFASRRAKAVHLVAEALAAKKPSRLRRRLTMALATLRATRRKIAHARSLDPGCRAALEQELDAALAFVRSQLP